MSESYKPPCAAKATTEDYIALSAENDRLIAAVKESEKRWSQEFRMREAAERELAVMTARVEKMESGVCADCLILERAREYQGELAVARVKSRAFEIYTSDVQCTAREALDRARAEQGQPATDERQEALDRETMQRDFERDIYAACDAEDREGAEHAKD